MRISLGRLCLLAALAALAILAPGCSDHTAPAPRTGPPVGVSDGNIRVGSSLALTGHAAYLGVQTLRGVKTYLNHVNDQGGVHGRKIEFEALDDGYEPSLCLYNTQKLLVEGDVFALSSYVGTPTTVKILPLVEKGRIPLVGVFSGANALREPFQRYVINVRPSYYQETGQAVNHFVKDLGLKRIAVFYQYDAYGLDGLRGAEIALQRFDLTPVAKGSYIRGTLDVAQGLNKIMAAEPEAVVMIGTSEPCARFIRWAKERKTDVLFYNVSFVGGEELAKLLGPQGEGVIVSQVVPPPELPETQDMLFDVKEYKTLSEKYFPGEDLSSVSLEGFYNAFVLVEGLRLAGRDLDRERFIAAVETIAKRPLGPDNELSFSPEDHQGMDKVYFTAISRGKLKLITDWKTQVGARRPNTGGGK